MPKSTTQDLSAKVKVMAAAAALAAGALIAFSGPGHTASDDTPTTPTSCPSGYVWSSSKGKCVRINSSVEDEELYEQGRALANAGQYEKAIQVLRTMSNQNEPRVLNYLGFSHRKLGQLDKGISYYAKALAIDPGFVRAREYLGEGYVAAGELDKALEQLREIASLCGTDCKEYQELAQVIVAAGGSVQLN